MSVRWLHLSDVHEKKDQQRFRRKMYDEIIEEVRRHPKPDLVFLTGDMAFGGAKDEYERLESGFIYPLKKILPDAPMFTIPGNHDVDRKAGTKPRLWIGDPEESEAFQAPDVNGKRKRREVLLPRFAAYADFDKRVSSWGSRWLESEVGSVWWTGEVAGTRLAIIGCNTAWLCQDDHDWGKLTPGRYMLEAALDAATKQKPDLLIVLGHHPLASLSVEGLPGDGPRVSERLKQANALYLHGHLHLSGSDRTGDSLRNVLTIQAPSAFQAHDNERWRNGIMYGEADVESGWLFLEPLRWNERDREYKWDVDAGYNVDRAPGRDAFHLRLPSRPLEDNRIQEPPNAPEAKPIDVPEGWEIVDRADLERVRVAPPSADEVVAFFDGFLPNWKLALAQGVRPRAIVSRLTARLKAAHNEGPKPIVVLLAAAGGEGKSTALLHAAAALVEDDTQEWKCLHRKASRAPLPEDLFVRLPVKADMAWVVVIDDADNIGPAILAATKRLGARTDIHILLAARDAEWRMKRLVPGMWDPTTDFHSEPLTGLDAEDAGRIVAGWHAWGAKGMGLLKGKSEAEASSILVAQAHDLAARQEEGSLLGALLITRQGEDMRGHVRTLVNGLGREPVLGRSSLRDIYAIVAAMHAENQLYLSRPVLAFALGCEVDELERKALDILRREAMLDAGDTYVLTRHRRIAEAACIVLHEDGYDIDALYPQLARIARRHYHVRRFTPPDIANWTFDLAIHFFDKGERWWTIANNIARAVYDAEPGNVQSLTALSNVLRKTGRAAEAMTLLREVGETFKKDRGLLYEWSAVAGNLGDHGLNAWLGGKSVADGIGTLDSRRCKLSLGGLGVAFRELFAVGKDKRFATAQAACGQLGFQLDELNPTDQRYFESYVEDGRRNGVASLSPQNAIDAIRRAVILGAEDVELTNDPVFFERLLKEPESYHYTALLRLCSGRKDTKS